MSLIRQRGVFVAFVAAFAITVAGCLPVVPPTGGGPVRYRDDVFANVQVTRGVQYGAAPNQQGQMVNLLLDVYEPSGDTKATRPAIVWVHGGSFCCGSRTSGEI